MEIFDPGIVERIGAAEDGKAILGEGGTEEIESGK